MAWTQADLDALNVSIQSGVKKVTFSDSRSTEYQTLAEMLQLRSTMKAELAALASQINPRFRTTVGRVRRS